MKPVTAENLRAAGRFAHEMGLPLNRHITINWEQLGIPDFQMAGAISALMKSLRAWFRRQGVENAHIWVRERSSETGAHCHILLHMPARLTLGKRHIATLRWITGQPYRKGAVRTRSIRGASGACDQSVALYRENLDRLIDYALKDEDTPPSPAANRYSGNHGTIIGKRAATSQNIGLAARTRAARTS